jgi:uncharacterized membrane protein YbhN (UPF0104 family)
MKQISRTNGLAFSIFKLLIALSVIGSLVYFNRIGLADFSGLTATWPWLLGAFLLMLPPIIIVSYRFKLILHSQGVIVPLWLALRWTMVGYFFDLVMPSSNGGDIVKAGYVVDYVGAGQRSRAIMAVGFDRVIGLLGLFLLAFTAGALGWNLLKDMPGYNLIQLLTISLTIFSLIIVRVIGSRFLYHNVRFNRWLCSRRWGKWLNQIVGSFNAVREEPLKVIVALILSMLNHMFWCSSLILIAYAAGNIISPIKGFVVFPLAIFSNIFGVAGGFGLGTAGFDLLLSKLLSVQNGALIGLLFQTLSAFSRLLGLIFYLRPYKTNCH